MTKTKDLKIKKVFYANGLVAQLAWHLPHFEFPIPMSHIPPSSSFPSPKNQSCYSQNCFTTFSHYDVGVTIKQMGVVWWTNMFYCDICACVVNML